MLFGWWLTMPTKTSQVKGPICKNLVGGLNVRETICDIGDNEAAVLTNLTFYTAGSLVRRGGWQKLIANTPTANPLLGIFQPVFNTAGVFTYYLVITDGTNVWQTSNPAATPVVWTDITNGKTLDATQPYRFVMMANKMIIYNGVVAFYWTGAGGLTSFPAPGGGQITIPKSRIGIVWQNYLFWGGDGTNPARLYFSDLADPTVYPSANYIDVPNPFDGDQITGLAVLYGNLLIFKRFSLYILQGAPPANLILSKLNSSVGCVDPASVLQIDNLVYFVSDKGLFAANLFNVRQVCYKVEPRYTASVPYVTNSKPIWAAHYKAKGQIFITMNAQSFYRTPTAYNDRIMVHDYFNADQNGDPAVSEFVTGFTQFGLAENQPSYPTAPYIMGDYFYTTGSNPLAVMGSFNDPWVYVYTDGTLASGGPKDNISWMATPTYPPPDFLTKFFDAGDPDMIKQVRWLWTTGQVYLGQNLRAGIIYNNSPTTASFIDFTSSLRVLQAPLGNLYLVGVDNDGSLMLTLTTDNTYLTTLVLADSSGNNWDVAVTDGGAFDVTPSALVASSPPVLISSQGYQYQMEVETDGALNSELLLAPDTQVIIPGTRVAVLPFVNGIAGMRSGKYFQLYFSGIGILSQFSTDLVMKGRRN